MHRRTPAGRRPQRGAGGPGRSGQRGQLRQRGHHRRLRGGAGRHAGCAEIPALALVRPQLPARHPPRGPARAGALAVAVCQAIPARGRRPQCRRDCGAAAGRRAAVGGAGAAPVGGRHPAAAGVPLPVSDPRRPARRRGRDDAPPRPGRDGRASGQRGPCRAGTRPAADGGRGLLSERGLPERSGPDDAPAGRPRAGAGRASARAAATRLARHVDGVAIEGRGCTCTRAGW